MAVIASSGETDVTDASSYYDLWEAFVMLKGMCVRYGKTGRMSGLGRQERLTAIVQPYLQAEIEA